MSVAKEIYDNYRDLGMSRKAAAALAFVDSLRESELDRIDKGLDYSENEVRVASVHSRQDIALLAYYLGRIDDAAQSTRRWIIVLTVVLLISVFI